MQRKTMRIFTLAVATLIAIVGTTSTWAGTGQFFGGTVDPDPRKPGEEHDPLVKGYRFKDDVFIVRGNKALDVRHIPGFNPKRGLAEFDVGRGHSTRERAYFLVLDGKLASEGEAAKAGNRHRRSVHNQGRRALEAFSPDAPALKPANAAVVFFLYTYEPPKDSNGLRYQTRHVCRVEFKEGKAFRGWISPYLNNGLSSAVTTLDVGGLTLSNATVTGAIALPNGGERCEIDIDFKGAIVAGAFKTPDDKMKGGILGDLDWGHADLNAKPVCEIMLGHALGGDPTGKDDLVVTLTATGGKVEDVSARMFAGDRPVKVLEQQMQIANLDNPFGTLTVQVGESKYHVSINKGIQPYNTGLLGDTVLIYIQAQVRRDGPNGEQVNKNLLQNFTAITLVRNAWLGRLPKTTADQAGAGAQAMPKRAPGKGSAESM